MPDFEVYLRTKSRSRTPRTATVTIQRAGRFSFSPAAMTALGDPDALVLLYDREQQLIGFRAAARSNPDAYSVLTPGRGRARHVMARSLCQFLGIDVSEARRYPLETGGEAPYIDLSKGTTVTRGS